MLIFDPILNRMKSVDPRVKHPQEGWRDDDPTRAKGYVNLAYDADTLVTLFGNEDDISSVILDLYNPLALTGPAEIVASATPVDGSDPVTASVVVEFDMLEAKAVTIPLLVSKDSELSVSRNWALAGQIETAIRCERVRVV